MKAWVSLVLEIGFFFAWLLSLPLYGPLLERLASIRNAAPASGLQFAEGHALGLIALSTALFLLAKRDRHEPDRLNRALELGVVALCIASTVWLVSGQAPQQPLALVICGIASAGFVIPWTHRYVRVIPQNRRAAYMASAMAISNAIYGTFVFLGPTMSQNAILISSCLLLVLSGLLLLHPLGSPQPQTSQVPAEAGSRLNSASHPGPAQANTRAELNSERSRALRLLSLVLAFQMVAGFYYEVTIPQFSGIAALAAWDRWFRSLPYIASLPLAVYLRNHFGPALVALVAIVSMGTSYAILPLLPPTASYFLTFSLIQAAFGLADVSL